MRLNKEDLGLFLVSFIVAMALWFNIALSREETQAEKPILDVKVNVTNVSTKLDYEIRPRYVNVVLQGSTKALSKVTADEINITVDMYGLTEGQWHVFPRATVPEPGRMRIVKIIPERIDVTLHPIRNGTTHSSATTATK
jgi:YbbR domain-containing protein